MPTPTPSHRGPRARAGLLPALALAAACSTAAPPVADQPQAPIPDLTGTTIMVLPAQGRAPDGFDDELRFWLEAAGGGIAWVFPERLERAIARSPALADIRLNGLAVSSFRRAQVERIGDPLFGDLRRLGAVVDARYALLPVNALYVPPDTSRQAGRVEVAAALIDTMGGRVLWYGVVAGERGEPGDPAVVAGAARMLARRVVP